MDTNRVWSWNESDRANLMKNVYETSKYIDSASLDAKNSLIDYYTNSLTYSLVKFD